MVTASRAEMSMRDRIEKILKENMDKNVEVDVADDSTTSYQHFVIMSDHFKKLGHVERQEHVWGILRKHFSEQEFLTVTMIQTYTKDEAQKLLVG